MSDGCFGEFNFGCFLIEVFKCFIFCDCRTKELEVLKYYFCEYIVEFLTWFKIFSRSQFFYSY